MHNAARPAPRPPPSLASHLARNLTGARGTGALRGEPVCRVLVASKGPARAVPGRLRAREAWARGPVLTDSCLTRPSLSVRRRAATACAAAAAAMAAAGRDRLSMVAFKPP